MPRSQSAMAAVWVNPAGEAGQAAEGLKVSQLLTHQKPAPGGAGSPSVAGRPADAGVGNGGPRRTAPKTGTGGRVCIVSLQNLPPLRDTPVVVFRSRCQ